jgi:hypothetical protein
LCWHEHDGPQLMRISLGSTTEIRAMVSLRCTQKLLRHWPGPIEAAPLPTTTVLGDWYCTALNHRHRRLILGLAERSLLPVVVPAKEFGTFPDRLAAEALRILEVLGVSAKLRDQESRGMAEWVIAKTNNRSVLGSIKDLGFLALVFLDRYPEATPEALAAELIRVPCGPLEHVFPGKQTQLLFRAA